MSNSKQPSADAMRKAVVIRILGSLVCWCVVGLDLSGNLFYWSSGRGPTMWEWIGHGIAILGCGAMGTVLAISAIVHHWRWQRVSTLIGMNRCMTCGYDLRASPERCPECGMDANAP